MEFVYLNSDISKSVEEYEDDERFKEREGLERVLEALETNMWENMVHKTDNRPLMGLAQLNSGRRYARDEDDEDLDEDLFNGLQVAEPPVSREMNTNDTNSDKTTDLTEEKKVNKVESRANTSTVPELVDKGDVDGATLEGIEANPLLNGALFKQINDSAGDSFDTFDKALNELRSLRQQASALPDEQRRDLAARVAMAFLQFTDDDD